MNLMMASSCWGLCGSIPRTCSSTTTSGTKDLSTRQGDCSLIMWHTESHPWVTCASNRYPCAVDARLIAEITLALPPSASHSHVNTVRIGE